MDTLIVRGMFTIVMALRDLIEQEKEWARQALAEPFTEEDVTNTGYDQLHLWYSIVTPDGAMISGGLTWQ